MEEKAIKVQLVHLDHLEKLEKTEDPDLPDLMDLRLVSFQRLLCYFIVQPLLTMPGFHSSL